MARPIGYTAISVRASVVSQGRKMTQEGKSHKQSNVQAKPVIDDLSQAIDQMMERQPDEQVRTVRVFEDRYRCNWWVREKTTHWMSFSTAVIRKSRFLRATQAGGKLLIEDLSDRR
jgi:hypothetical protein